MAAPLNESTQVSEIYVQAQALSQDAVREGYDCHAVAEGLLCAAQAILADKTEFRTVFERFQTLHGLS